MKKYCLIIDEKQLSEIAKALDFTMRIQLGQLEELYNPVNSELDITRTGVLEDAVYEVKKIAFPELGRHSSYGILNKEKVPESARIKYDILNALKKAKGDGNSTFVVSENGIPEIKELE